MRIALFPGSFDPFTIGHFDIVERALAIFDEVVIAVGFNEQKAGWQSIEERLKNIRDVYTDEPRVQVISYSGLTADLVHHLRVSCILRGVRSIKDYEYEQQMADVNRMLCGVDTVLLYTRPELACISSSMVRELSHFGQDVSAFLPIAKDKK